MAHIESLARQRGCTPAQLALGWVMRNGNDIVPIPGSKRVERLEENARAIDVANSLDDDAMRVIDELLPAGAAAGLRYPEGGMKTLNR